jgi:hypothetical protein
MTQLGKQKNAKSWCRGRRADCAIVHPSHVRSRTLSRDYHFHAEVASHWPGSFCKRTLPPSFASGETRLPAQCRRALSVPVDNNKNKREAHTVVEYIAVHRSPPWSLPRLAGAFWPRRKQGRKDGRGRVDSSDLVDDLLKRSVL